MADIEKVKLKMQNEEYMNELLEYQVSAHFECNISVLGKPESYSRERKGKNSFYNLKSKKMNKFRIDALKSLDKYKRDELSRIIQFNSIDVRLEIRYYLPIQKGDSIKDTILKEKGLIRPRTRPDLDNYDKFLLASLHAVLYKDDSVVTSISSKKFYSLTPRTEIEVDIYY